MKTDALTKIELLKVLEVIDTSHPSEFYVTQSEQWDVEDASWSLRHSFDGGNAEGRVFTDQQLRKVFLKALAYDELIASIGVKDDPLNLRGQG